MKKEMNKRIEDLKICFIKERIVDEILNALDPMYEYFETKDSEKFDSMLDTLYLFIETISDLKSDAKDNDLDDLYDDEIYILEKIEDVLNDIIMLGYETSKREVKEHEWQKVVNEYEKLLIPFEKFRRNAAIN